MTAPVLFEEIPADNGKLIGLVTLNVEKTLNSLTLEMCNLLLEKLEVWEHREDIACLLIKGAGPKAFCAGGDVQALYQSAIDQPGGPCEYAEEFFAREYRLDYRLHTYIKPIIAWGHGIVMGGGLGVMAGCSHRVVTEKTRIAMPEVTIALFPDVGGSWFLNHMPEKAGTFLALTGASINAADTLFTGLADYFLPNEEFDRVIAALKTQPWASTSQHNHDLLSELLTMIEGNIDGEAPEGNVEKHLATINELCTSDDVLEVYQAITSLESDDEWLTRARDGLSGGSPLSALIIFKQLQVSAGMTLAEVFQSELQLATNVVRYPEFAEGVRALLIDKDRNPRWQFKQPQDVPADLLEGFFTAPTTGSNWPDNPIADLPA